VNAGKVSLTIGAFVALSVPAAHAAVILGDGAGATSNTARTPAAAAAARHHKSVKKHAAAKDVPPPVPPNYWQVQKNIRWAG
jgi:hypothetical protein